MYVYIYIYYQITCIVSFKIQFLSGYIQTYAYIYIYIYIMILIKELIIFYYKRTETSFCCGKNFHCISLLVLAINLFFHEKETISEVDIVDCNVNRAKKNEPDVYIAAFHWLHVLNLEDGVFYLFIYDLNPYNY